MTDSIPDDGLAPELRELIERRTSLQQWLAALDDQRGTASERILQRVRQDYETRLASTNAELSEHVAGIRSEMERALEQALGAEREHDGAADALEEARLRHAIGELPGDGWSDRERELLESVKAAKIAEDQARTAADRLKDLLSTLTLERPAGREVRVEAPSDTGDEVASVPASQPPPERVTEPPAAQPTLDKDSTVESGTEPAGKQGEAFLEEVSVAVEAEAHPDSPGLFDQNEMPSAEKKPPPGLKCAECGYTNDLSAWFCGVCGADVG